MQCAGARWNERERERETGNGEIAKIQVVHCHRLNNIVMNHEHSLDCMR